MSGIETQLTQMAKGDYDDHVRALRAMFDFSVQVLQPKGCEKNIIFLPLPTHKADAKYVRQMLKEHHVTPEHQRLIAALHKAERFAMKLGISGPAKPGRLYQVKASKPYDVSSAKHIDDD